MSSGSGGGFIFVNASGASPEDRKASTLARAFVMRNARTAQPWSTRGKEPIAGEGDEAIVTTQAGPSSASHKRGPKRKGPSALDEIPGMEIVFQGEVTIARLRNQPRLRCLSCGWWKPCHDGQDASSFVCEDCRVTQTSYESQPDTPVRGQLDPFSCMAVELDERSNTLLNYFLTAISPKLFPMPNKSEKSTVVDFHQNWLSPSLKQPAFAHSLLCLTALQMAYVQPDVWPPPADLAAYHRIKAITAIQETLNDPQQSISDETIAAVFNLLCFEENLFIPSLRVGHLRPDVAQRAAHAKGLNQMIRMRGGIQGLSSSLGRILQLFIIRHSVAHVATSFQRAYGIPGNLLKKLYDYPNISKFSHEPASVSRRCQSVGMSRKMTHLVRCAECIIKDKELYSRNPEASKFGVYDMQMLFSTFTGQVWAWYMEAEEAGTLPASEAVVVFCITYLLAIVYKSKFTAIPSARENALSRVNQNLYDPECMNTLHAAGLDVWAALVAVTMAVQPYYDHFWSVWIEVIDRQTEAPIKSFGDLKVALEKGIWVPSEHDIYAQCVWDDTIREATPGSASGSANKEQRVYSTITEVSTSFSSPNPYVNYQARSWTPIDNTSSEYAIGQ